MPIERIKVRIWWLLLLLVVAGVLITLTAVGNVITYMSTGADPASALNLIPVAPPDLEERLQWLPDQPLSDLQRVMEPSTRADIAGSYLRAWSQWGISAEMGQPYGLTTYFSGPALTGVTQNVTETVAAGWQVRQSNLHHELELYFYSDDGSIVAFADRNLQLVQHFRRQQGNDSFVVETSAIYDVLMLLQDGNWRIYQWRRQDDALPTTTDNWVDPAAPPDRASIPATILTLHDRRLWVDSAPYAVAGINYYPQRSPWTAFWPHYDPKQTTTDLALIRALGLNTVRIFISYTDFGGAQVQPAMRAKLSDFLRRAKQAGLKVIVTLFDHHTDHHPTTWAADARHLATLLPYFANNPTILAWDIKNEPDRDDGYNTQPLVDGWLRFVARHVRWHDPNHLITIGWSTPEAAARLPEIVDFVAFHYFAQPEDYNQRVTALQSVLGGNKPILLEEFTYSTWNSPFFPGHSEAEQADYYAAILRQHRTLDSLGYLHWTLYDFDDAPLAEFRYPWRREMQTHMGIIRHNGTAKPAAVLVAPGANLDLPVLASWHAITNPFWLTFGLLLLTLGIGGWYFRRGLHRINDKKKSQP